MTHPTISFKTLRSMTTTDLRTHATAIGATPQSYGRTGLIDAIEAIQPTVVADADKLSIDDYIERGEVECPTELGVYTALIQSESLRQVGAAIGQVDPDGDLEIYEVQLNGQRCVGLAFIGGDCVILDQWHLGEYYDYPEAAAIAWLEVNRPAEMLLAAASARHIVADRFKLVDYM